MVKVGDRVICNKALGTVSLVAPVGFSVFWDEEAHAHLRSFVHTHSVMDNGIYPYEEPLRERFMVEPVFNLEEITEW